TLDYISFHYYYDVDNNFTSLGMYDAASNSVYGPAYGEFARFNGGKTEDCYAEFEITAPKAGYYVVDLEAQQQDNSGISRFETYVNGEKAYGTTELPKLVYGTPAHATSPENERRYLRDYQFVVYLNENTNKLKLVALNERSNQWLLIDKLTVSTLPAPEASKVRLEGEHAYNTAEAYTLLTHGSAKLVGYTDFSNGITLQTYGTRSDESTDELELKYTVEAPAAGAYNMGLLCNSSGSNFDMGINNVRYSSVRANSTRTTNAIASSSSTAASDMYLYSYNNRVYLTEGTNEITVYVKPRTDDGAYIVDIDYFDFNLKEAGADDPVLTISNVTYNGVDAAPTAGTNDVELNLSNITPFDTGDIYVIAAVYDAGVLKNAYVETASVGAGESDIPVTFSGLTYESGNTINIFAWGKTNIAPLAKEIYTYTETASEEQE
ncbi:MAG: hypothetical protein IJ366_10135, partial [Clostridia bacterium]|nr:hypothetical protein [Clostridia bacterium]